MMLLTVGLVGILSFDELFLGFASPAVITVAAALVMGRALYNSGILDRVEEYLLKFDKRPLMPLLLLLVVVAVMSGFINNMAALAIIFGATLILSNVINNVAAAVFMAPVAIRLSEMLGISGFPMVMGVAFASALPFLTPIGHQSSLLVMEAGGYKFSDYLKFGLPLTAACTVVVLLIIPVVWPF
jgi:di/tricarboxylate transporter